MGSNLAAMLQGIYGLQGSFAPCVLQKAVAKSPHDDLGISLVAEVVKYP